MIDIEKLKNTGVYRNIVDVQPKVVVERVKHIEQKPYDGFTETVESPESHPTIENLVRNADIARNCITINDIHNAFEEQFNELVNSHKFEINNSERREIIRAQIDRLFVEYEFLLYERGFLHKQFDVPHYCYVEETDNGCGLKINFNVYGLKLLDILGFEI